MPTTSSLPCFRGLLVDGRYRLSQLIGIGSYGVVYRAVDVHSRSDPTNYHRAVKIISKSGRRLSELEVIRREVALHSAVSGHPNIVRMYKALEDAEYFYIVLDLCKGGDLFEAICEKAVFANQDGRLRKTFLSLVDAVQACHKAHVFHRDIKPENILTNADGTAVYLADFGLATDKTIVDEHGCGTEYYMSPEGLGRLTRFKPFSTRYGDVWSLGVILVNMMSGRHPWAIAAPEDECFAQYMRDPDYLKKTLPISDGANTILRRIFTLDPRQRISLTDLRRAISELNTFFLSEDELAHASECAQFVAASIRAGRGFTGSTTGSVASGATQDELSEEDIVEEDIVELQIGYTHTTSKTLFTTPATEIPRLHYPELVIEEQECLCAPQSTGVVDNASLQPGDTGAKRARDEKDLGEAVWKRARHIGPGDT